MSCLTCKFCFKADSGYSNYTVEDTSIDCFLNANPHFPVGEYYGNFDEKAVSFDCAKFQKGEQIHFDVDGEITLLNETKDGDVILAAIQGQHIDVKTLLDFIKTVGPSKLLDEPSYSAIHPYVIDQQF
jgi:hypothetical protein